MKQFTIALLSLCLALSITGPAMANTYPAPSAIPDKSGDLAFCHSFDVNLWHGLNNRTTSGYVNDLQNFLISRGYLGAQYSTGYFGVLTLKAVKQFQKDNGISPTGYVGPITRAKIKALTCAPTLGISYSVTTNNKSYVSGDENIVITLEAKNNSTVDQSFTLNDGCQPNYRIVQGSNTVYYSAMGKLCAMVVTPITLKPGESKIWTLTHTPDTYHLIQNNEYTIEAIINGMVVANTKIFIQATPPPTVPPTSTIKVVSPNGGETWYRAARQTIAWDSPNVTYIQAPRFDIYLMPERPACLDSVPRCMIAERAPYVLAQNVIGSAGRSTYDWTVGSTTQSFEVTDGRYQVKVCNAGSTDVCDVSDQLFTITTFTRATTTTIY